MTKQAIRKAIKAHGFQIRTTSRLPCDNPENQWTVWATHSDRGVIVKEALTERDALELVLVQIQIVVQS